MRMNRLSSLSLILSLVCALGGAAPAQEMQPVPEGAEDIPVEEWTAMAMGKTLVYRIDGQLWAHEHYFPGTNHVMLQLYDGSCMSGTWDYSEPLYCFHWDVEGTACFRHARRGDEILILEAAASEGVPLIQEMTAVTDIPLQCEPPIS